jgi:3-oxoadipate enol-lactonase
MTDYEDQRILLPGGLELQCHIEGRGTVPVIFVHGYSMSLDSWSRVQHRLPARYRSYAYDLRGFGGSGRQSGYTIEDHEGDLLALMDRLGLETAILIGHSLGAAIVQGIAARAPERVRALVLSNARSRHFGPPDAKASVVAERMAAYGSPARNRQVLAERMPLYFDPRHVDAADIERFVEIGAKADTDALRETLHALYTRPAMDEARFSTFNRPVLVVCGEMDASTAEPIENARSMTRIFPQAEIVVMRETGHTPMWETPGEWSRDVYGFLDRTI